MNTGETSQRKYLICELCESDSISEKMVWLEYKQSIYNKNEILRNMQAEEVQSISGSVKNGGQ